MPVETTTTWTCERWGTSIVTPNREQPPKPWGSLRLFFPPLTNEDSIRYLICPSCEHSLADWLDLPTPEPKEDT
jgi:hypothetical protein